MDRDKFFATLDQLTPSQIEARLSSWNDEELKLVEEYLERKASSAGQSQQVAQLAPDRDRETIAVVTAVRAHKIATVALIIAIGAMVAAVVSGLVAFEAFRHLSNG
jgi:hypothetical protein